MHLGMGNAIHGDNGFGDSGADGSLSSPSIYGYPLPVRPPADLFSIPIDGTASEFARQEPVVEDTDTHKGCIRAPFSDAFQEFGDCFQSLRDQWKVSNGELFAAFHVFLVRTPPLLAIGAYLQSSTDFSFGPAEIILATALGFFASALLSSRPNTHIGVSPSSAIFISYFHVLCPRLQVAFLPAFAWTALWCTFILLGLAAAGSRLGRPSRIGWEIGRLFVAFTLSAQGITLLTRSYDALGVAPGLVATWLACGTVLMTIWLSTARRWSILSGGVRRHLADYSAMWSLIIFTALQSLPFYTDPPLDRLRLFFPPFGSRTGGSGFLYLPVSLLEVPRVVAIGAALPGSLLAALLFADHCVAVSGGQRQSSAILLLVAGLTFVCGLFGLPPVVTFFPADREGDGEGSLKSYGGRASLLLVASALFLLLLPGIQCLPAFVPQPVAAGLLITMGLSCLPALSFSERILSLATDKPYGGNESRARRLILSLLQLLLAGCLCALFYFPPAAVTFPFFLLLLLQTAGPILRTCFGEAPSAPLHPDHHPEPLALSPATPEPSLPLTTPPRPHMPRRWAAKDLWLPPGSPSSMGGSPKNLSVVQEEVGEEETAQTPPLTMSTLGREVEREVKREGERRVFDNALFQLLPLPPIDPSKEPAAATRCFQGEAGKGEKKEKEASSTSGSRGGRQEGSGARAIVDVKREQEQASSLCMEREEQSVASIVHQAVQKAVVNKSC